MTFLSQDVRINISSLLNDAYACRGNNLAQSTAFTEKALALSNEVNDKSLITQSLNQLALFAMIRGEYDSCVAMSLECIKHFEELQDEKGIANAKYNIAGAYYKTNNFHLGLTYLIDCLVIYRKFNDYHNQARVEKSLGTIYEYFGDEKKAIQSYEDAIEAARKAGDAALESNAYNPLSGIYLKQGKIEKATEIIDHAIAMKQQTGDTRGLAFSIYGRGKVYTKIGEFDKAEADFNEAIAIHKQMGERLGLGMAYYKISALYLEMGRLDAAKELLNTALNFSREYNIIMIIFKCSHLLYRIHKQEGDMVQALAYLELYLEKKEIVINTQTLKVIENYELVTKMESLEKEAQVQREKAEIIEKKNRAEKVANTRQEFLSTMSHEIRTPLNAVITIASLLENKPVNDEKQLVDSLKFSANHLLNVINDVLDFSKLDAGKAKIEAQPSNIYTLLNNIKNAYINMAHQKGIALELTIDTNVDQNYEIDETKLSQILGNLISNAIKFTDRGAVEIHVEKTNTSKQYDHVLFRIVDSGTGIEEKYLDEVFDSFAQPLLNSRHQGGSGLGLAIVKQLVNLYGGEIKLDSIVGKGSVFYFELNLKKSGKPAKADIKYTDQLKNKHVLLAEDNMINALLISRVLSNWDVTSEHVRNGDEAVKRSAAKTYDFILMDIHMAEMNGFEATRHIRNCKHLHNVKTPIFAISADITASHKEEYSHYFDGFLNKPIEIDKLYEALVNQL
jgi:signal transduction histidine kinase/CheY-like chemotaxis protein